VTPPAFRDGDGGIKPAMEYFCCWRSVLPVCLLFVARLLPFLSSASTSFLLPADRLLVLLLRNAMSLPRNRNVLDIYI
jgi:hypothetical protein